MNPLYAKMKIKSLIDYAYAMRSDMKIIIIATTKDGAASCSDYKLHSVTTSYLSRQELEELIPYFRNYCSYLEVYTDIEEFLRDYYTLNLRIHPTLIFETSPKGIGRGKDALIPAICDILHIPHLGAEATSSIVCSSKYQWTSALRANGIPVPESYLFAQDHWIIPPPAAEKYILKLNYECASIGLSAESVMVNDGKNLTEMAETLTQNYKQPVIAQTYIEGYEVEVPVIINPDFSIVLPPIGLATDNKKYYDREFFDYDAIYFDNYNLYEFEQEMPTAADALQECSYRIIDILDLSGYMRIDFRVRLDGSYYVFDINNDPCINACGSFQKSFSSLGFEPHEVAGALIGNRMFNRSIFVCR